MIFNDIQWYSMIFNDNQWYSMIINDVNDNCKTCPGSGLDAREGTRRGIIGNAVTRAWQPAVAMVVVEEVEVWVLLIYIYIYLIYIYHLSGSSCQCNGEDVAWNNRRIGSCDDGTSISCGNWCFVGPSCSQKVWWSWAGQYQFKVWLLANISWLSTSKWFPR